MNRSLHSIILALALSLSAAAPARADIVNEQKVVEGLAFYLGIVPAEIVRGHPSGHEERGMHGGPPSHAGQYHVMVAIFDAASGKRVTDASVKARVESVGLGGQERALEAMPVAGAMTYGNYFGMVGNGPFRIILQVVRPGMTAPIEVRFEHTHR